jgi:hypothetical protein
MGLTLSAGGTERGSEERSTARDRRGWNIRPRYRAGELEVCFVNNAQNHQGHMTGWKSAEIRPVIWTESLTWRNSVSAWIELIGLVLGKDGKISVSEDGGLGVRKLVLSG